MKKIAIAILASIAMIGAASAGCGKKVTNEGTLSSYDADSKAIVVVGEDGKKAKLTLTPKTVIKDADGKEIKLEDLVEKSVKVTSEHKKVDSVEAKAS